MFISMFASGGLSTRSPALSAAHPTSAPRSDRERRGRERKEVTKEEEEESPSGGRTCGEKAVLFQQELMKYQAKTQFPTNIIYKRHHVAICRFSLIAVAMTFSLYEYFQSINRKFALIWLKKNRSIVSNTNLRALRLHALPLPPVLPPPPYPPFVPGKRVS